MGTQRRETNHIGARSMVSLGRRFLVVIVSLLLLAGCGESSDPAVDDVGAERDTELQDLSGADGMFSDTTDANSDAMDDSAEDMTTTEVYTDPVVFSVLKLDPELREIAYMNGARFITVPRLQVEAETLGREPIPGQTIAFDFRFQSTVSPDTSVTDENGRTEELSVTFGGDFTAPASKLFITPYISALAPEAVHERSLDAVGVSVEVVYPTDESGDPVPLVNDGTSSYPMQLVLNQVGSDKIPADVEVEIEFITNTGPSPVSIDGEAGPVIRWAVPRENSTLDFTFKSTGEGDGNGRFFLRMYQLGSKRGERTETMMFTNP